MNTVFIETLTGAYKVMLIKRINLKDKKAYVFECDACKKSFLRCRKTRKYTVDYCSIDCLKSHLNILDEKTYKCLLGSLKRKQTMKEKYGFDNAFNAFSTQIKQTMLKKHGVEHAAQNPLVMKKVFATNLLKGHVHNVHCVPFVSPFSDKNVQAKAQSTILNKYGTTCAANSSLARQHDRQESYKLAHETKKKRGLLKQSNVEKFFREKLEVHWGVENVIKHVLINGWSIDVYIVPVNTYVQIDGIYWHGLDRTIEFLQKSNKKIDKAILRKYYRDRQQDDFFSTSTAQLVRITDKEINQHKDNVDELLRKKGLLKDGKKEKDLVHK